MASMNAGLIMSDSLGPLGPVTWGASGSPGPMGDPSLRAPYGTASSETGAVFVDKAYLDAPFASSAPYEGVMNKICNYILNDHDYKFRYIQDAEKFTNIGGWSLERLNPGSLTVHDAIAAPGVEVDMFNIYIQPSCTQKLVDFKVREIGPWLRAKAHEGFLMEFDKASLHGNGIDRPKGIFTARTPSISVINSGADGAVTMAGLLDLYYSLDPAYLLNASWLMHPLTMKAIRGIPNGPFAMPDSSQTNAIFGNPVYLNQYMPQPASGAQSIIFGDFKAACFYIDSTTLLLEDKFSYKPLYAYYCNKYFGFDVCDTKALKILQLSV